tara:strand:- start:487 stop:705 length:219 start_codon:yes stop_codon:yes gene_type:complete
MSDGSGIAVYNNISGNSVFIATKPDSSTAQHILMSKRFSATLFNELLEIREYEASIHLKWLLTNRFIKCVEE